MKVEKEYYPNGDIENIQYYVNGKKHRTDGPASIEYNENGNIEKEIYCVNNTIYTDMLQYLIVVRNL